LKQARSARFGGTWVIVFPKIAVALTSEELTAMFLDRLKVLEAGLLALCAAAAIAFLSMQSARADKKKAVKDEKAILGTWTVESYQEGGQKAAKEVIETLSVVFSADGKMKAIQGEKEQELTWKLDPGKKPKQFSVTNDKGREVLGIYKLDGDTLTVCWARGGDRPDEFASKKGTSVVLQVLKRQKE
jgi:uncharacterized protein (TIGR03067 family)